MGYPFDDLLVGRISYFKTLFSIISQPVTIPLQVAYLFYDDWNEVIEPISVEINR